MKLNNNIVPFPCHRKYEHKNCSENVGKCCIVHIVIDKWFHDMSQIRFFFRDGVNFDVEYE